MEYLDDSDRIYHLAYNAATYGRPAWDTPQYVRNCPLRVDTWLTAFREYARHNPSMRCEMSKGCMQSASFWVARKWIAGDKIAVCKSCANRIGKESPLGPVINMPGRESQFYRIDDLSL